MYLTVLILHIIVSLALVCFIMLQHGKGADAGVAFGAGNSSGGHGQNMGMTKLIGCLAVCFFATSLALGFLSSHNQSVVPIERETSDVKTQELDPLAS